MLRSKNNARAVCLFHYIELVPLILPLPPVENLCLATFTETASESSTSSSANSSSGSKGVVSAVAVDDTGDKKKKKKGNNDAEAVYSLSPSEIAFIEQSARDFHPYGCCASLIHSILEKCAYNVFLGGTGTGTEHSAIGSKGGDLESPQHSAIVKIKDQMKGYLYHFFKDLPQTQSEETGKILRYNFPL